MMTMEEEIEEDCRRHQAKTLHAETIVRREKRLNAERYNDDHEFLKKADESLDWWLEQQSLKSHS
jgi:hypothetical protein